MGLSQRNRRMAALAAGRADLTTGVFLIQRDFQEILGQVAVGEGRIGAAHVGAQQALRQQGRLHLGIIGANGGTGGGFGMGAGAGAAICGGGVTTASGTGGLSQPASVSPTKASATMARPMPAWPAATWAAVRVQPWRRWSIISLATRPL